MNHSTNHMLLTYIQRRALVDQDETAKFLLYAVENPPQPVVVPEIPCTQKELAQKAIEKLLTALADNSNEFTGSVETNINDAIMLITELL